MVVNPTPVRAKPQSNCSSRDKPDESQKITAELRELWGYRVVTDHSPNRENHKALVEEEAGRIDPNESLAQR